MAKQEETNRKIHLDFHTPHWVKQVGQDYDPELLVRTWKEAHINAVTVVFGLCACGNAYYKSDVAPVHPGLQQDLLTPLLPIARREGIKIYVHFGPGINDRSVVEHPEWAMQTKNGKRLDTNEGKEWGWVCYNSPYVETLLWPQLREFVPRFPEVEGIFIDMVTYAPQQTCHCEYCVSKAAALDLNLNDDEQLIRFQRITLENFIDKTRELVKGLNPEMEFTCNNRWFVGGARNQSLDFIELEAPVTWNSYHFPVMSRHIRTLPIASGGMTTRFPKNWGYFGSLNNELQLKFECSTILATLGSCCIGDQLHPSGKPEPGVYELIKTVYEFVMEREQWSLNAKSVPYMAIMADVQPNTSVARPKSDASEFYQGGAAFYGAGLILLEGNRHFDVLDSFNDISPYKLLWFPENKTFDPKAAKRVKQFVADGGSLLVTGKGLWQVEEWKSVLEEMAGVSYVDTEQSPGGFIQPEPEFADHMPQVPYFVKGGFVQWKLADGSDAQVAAKAYKPYEDISPSRKFGHFHAPAGEEAAYPGAVIRKYGKGKVVVVAASLALDYFTIGSRHVRQMVLNLVDGLLDKDQRLIEVDAGTPSVDVSLMSQEGNWVLHLIQYGAKRQSGFSQGDSTSGNTVMEELPIRYNLPVRLRPETRPKRVLLAPAQTELPWTWNEGWVETVVPELHIHQMLVLEF
ncbi:MAG: hypothetical protein K0R67_2671 [Paenibacillus sp.]|nr:hypothetical protein [Paenibacillus sp.]